MKTITTSVAFTDPRNTATANGLLTLDLSQAAMVTSGGGQVAPSRVSITLDANGKIPAGTQIFANDELTPTGTTYKATLRNSNGLVVGDLGKWSITGASPIDLSQMVPVSTSTVSAPGVVFTAPAGNQTIVQPSGTNLLVNRFENIRFADQFSGADMGAQITAAIADLPTAGGVVDGRAFQGAQAGSLTISKSNVAIFLGNCTWALGTNQIIISPGTTGVRIVGIGP